MRTPGLLVLATLLTAGCGKSSYKVIDIPYCQAAPDTQERLSFAGTTRYVYRSGSSSGHGPVSGTWPHLGIGVQDAIERDSMLLAVVSCAPPTPGKVSVTSSEPDATARQLSETSVPALCPGQKVLYHGTLRASDDAIAKERGYTGVVRFPEIASLTCPVGTVRRTTSADIEPRPR